MAITPHDEWQDPPMSPLESAIEAYRDRFGAAPGVWGLAGIGRDDELAALILAAVDAGEPFDAEAVAVRWGRAIPPGAVA